MIRFKFSTYFRKIFSERTGLVLDEETEAQILANMSTITPHKKVDNKKRKSEYYTFIIEGKLITVVVDGNTHKIITCVLETHHSVEFYRR